MADVNPRMSRLRDTADRRAAGAWSVTAVPAERNVCLARIATVAKYTILGVAAALLLQSQATARTATHRHAVPLVSAYVDDAVPMGDKIVAFARDHAGRAVGDGECYDLADQALLHAGAKSAPAYGRITGDADYVWGVPVNARDAKPGDIVQFHDYTIKTIVTGTDGGGATSQRWVTETREHHTSIVERNLGGQLVLLEQNVEPALVVQRTVVPIVNETIQGSPDGEPGNATTTFEVAGQANVYRPQSAHPKLVAAN